MQGKLIDITGQNFGRLFVVGRSENDNRGEARWNCVCDCGNNSIVLGSHLRRGRVVSCGCYSKEITSLLRKGKPTAGNFKHGCTRTRLYGIWVNMRTRCYNPNNRAYKWYGLRGISICSEWESFQPFSKWASISGYKNNLTIDRINGDGNYEPSNCRWVTKSDQQKNRRPRKRCN